MSLSECSVPRFVTISKSLFLYEGNGIVLQRTNTEPIRPTLMAQQAGGSFLSGAFCVVHVPGCLQSGGDWAVLVL